MNQPIQYFRALQGQSLAANEVICSVKVLVPKASIISTLPFQLVPAPGAGFAIVPVSAFLRCETFVAPSYSTIKNAIMFSIGNTGAIMAGGARVLASGITILNFSSVTTRRIGLRSSAFVSTTTMNDSLENSSIVLLKDVVTAGNSDIYIYLTYKLITL